jgi:hypothetical protein
MGKIIPVCKYCNMTDKVLVYTTFMGRIYGTIDGDGKFHKSTGDLHQSVEKVVVRCGHCLEIRMDVDIDVRSMNVIVSTD